MRALGNKELLAQQSVMGGSTKPGLDCMPGLGLEISLLRKLAGARGGAYVSRRKHKGACCCSSALFIRSCCANLKFQSGMP